MDKFKTNWIWSHNWTDEDDNSPKILYFRKELILNKTYEDVNIKISADSRYKLYINNKLVEIGPMKGDNQVWYYDTLNIAPYLKNGKNIIAVIVLRYPTSINKGNHSIFRTDTPGLYFIGKIKENDKNIINFSADESWKCKIATNIKLVKENNFFSPLYILEHASGNNETFGWMSANYDASNWENAKNNDMTFGFKAISPGNLYSRTIPYMKKIPKKFKDTYVVRKSMYSKSKWNNMLAGKNNITLKPNTTEIIEIDTGELMTGFLTLSISRGKNAKIEILQSEGYVYPPKSNSKEVFLPKKGDRTNSDTGILHGFTDTYIASGLGNNSQFEVYEPFWFRTFRYIQLKVTTYDEPLTIESFSYIETGYPLEVVSNVETSDKSLSDIWDISERTLKRCMHETYEDCPFYEQLQYSMDTRSQILFTYAISGDDRLARQCFDDFRRSQRHDGMINCSYPSYAPNIIPGFSIYYIMMIHDHMMYFADKELIRSYLSTIDGILEFFNKRLTKEGLVDKIGGPNIVSKYWSFIDWTSKWDKTSGVPTATLKGPITMESLLYIIGLEKASELAIYVGRKGIADEYKSRANKIKKAIKKYCIGSNGMMQDGPGIEEYSQHCQVFAILTDIFDKKIGKINLLKTLENKEKYAQSSYAMSFYLFRALEKIDMYEYTDKLWDNWRNMLKNNLTTCVEDPVGQRSDCHAWGSLALYELPVIVLGVKPTKPGFEDFEVKPTCGYLDWAKGKVKTPKGTIKVSWKKKNGNLDLKYEIDKV